MIQAETFTLKEELTKGLRRTGRSTRNSGALLICDAARPFEDGVRSILPILSPFDGSGLAWPFPQIFRGKSVTLACYITSIYLIDDTTWPWTKTQITTWNIDDPDVEKAIALGGTWHFADLFNSWVLTNGSCTIIMSNTFGLRGGTNKALVSTNLTPATCCEFQSRVILAGFASNSYWHSEWESFWREEGGDNVYLMDFTPEPNVVYFSSFGGEDSLFLFRPHLGYEGFTGSGHSTANPLYLEYVEKNEMGFMPLGFQGTVLKVAQIGDHIAIYTTDGVGVLTPIVVGGIATFKYQSLGRVGVLSRSAIGGDQFTHLFLDNGNYLWSLGADLRLTRLDYSEYMADMIGDVVITYDEREKEFYIATSGLSFILTQSGLGKASQAPTALFNLGSVIGTAGNTGVTTLELETDAFDMGDRGVKTVHSVEVGISSEGVVEVSLLYRHDKTQLYERTSWVTTDTEGFATFVQSGIEFKVAVRAYPAVNVEIDTVKVKWNLGKLKRNLSDLVSL